MDKKLEVKNLQISFRTQGGILKAVRNISFDLHAGETFAIVGESGSGKSVTSKAIMGILAGNSIVEGGEIIYDGQDLLKISEEDFHKLRGDKIAMIFQDPMSSLNPIMKVGQQLTEAMILKAKTGKKNAKRNFNGLLEILKKNIIETQVEDEKLVAEKVKTFDDFCIKNTELEGVFNEAYGSVTELEVYVKDLIVLFEKTQKINVKDEFKKIYNLLSESIHPYVIVANPFVSELLAKIKTISIQNKNANAKQVKEVLENVYELAVEALTKDAPNFFTLGYYTMKNPEANINNMLVSELNVLTREFLDKDFMLDFIKIGSYGVKNSHDKSIAAKQQLLPLMNQAIEYFNGENIDANTANGYVKQLSTLVKNSIDPLEVKKNSTQYVFDSAFATSVNEYFNGIKANPIEEKKYLKNKAEYDKLIAKGKTPDWILKPQIIVDLDLKLGNICKVLNDTKASIEYDINSNSTYDANAKIVEVIDYLKEQASKVVVKMNKSIAKAKAIKLLEEVGIPEPRIRFNQYPFEFSGGMRQRIVIAIALSANPDILICDEPTTALDVTIQSQILELINKIKEQRKLSVIFITHNLGVVANMADRIAVMYAGKIVEYGKSEEIFYEPAHPYTWALLSSMPDLHTKERLESIPGTPPNMIYPPKGDAFAARNKYALEIDFEMQPPLFEITDTHYAATWLLHPNAPKVEIPKIIKDRVERLKKGAE